MNSLMFNFDLISEEIPGITVEEGEGVGTVQVTDLMLGSVFELSGSRWRS